MKRLVEIDEGLIADLGFALKYLDELEKNPSRLFNLDQSKDLVLKVFEKLKTEWGRNNVKASIKSHEKLAGIIKNSKFEVLAKGAVIDVMIKPNVWQTVVELPDADTNSTSIKEELKQLQKEHPDKKFRIAKKK